jgi:Cys-tRNA(Pro) deacylase
LRAADITYEERRYDYSEGGGAAGGADQLGLDLHRVIKTLILELPNGDPLCVLMHGDREVSLKKLARTLGEKSVAMAPPERARNKSGYQVGGTSPFGLRTTMPIYCEASIADLDRIVINGGKRGFLIEIASADALALLQPQLVTVGV